VKSAAELSPAAAALAATLPPAPKPARPPRVKNPVLWEADLKRPKHRIDGKRWLAAVTEAAHARLKGDPLGPTIQRMAEILLWASERGRGIARIAQKMLGKLCVSGKETARKFVRFLEDCALLKTLNLMIVRERDGRYIRDVNAYELVLPEDGKPIKRERESDESRKVWWAVRMGLVVRRFGLNRTPERRRSYT
jgi:hypothetical protein